MCDPFGQGRFSLLETFGKEGVDAFAKLAGDFAGVLRHRFLGQTDILNTQ